MRFEEALLLAGKGQLITRPGYGVSFAAIREGQAVYGHFIGETGFTDVRAYVFTDEDKSATDWERFTRVLPDAWEGCDVPNGKNREGGCITLSPFSARQSGIWNNRE